MGVEAVIFDLDGLLLDTEPLYWQAANTICSRFGKFYEQWIVANVIGKQESIGAKIIIDSLLLPLTVEEFLKERDEMMEDIFPKAKPMPGAERLSFHLRNHNIPLAVATSSNRHAVELKLSQHQPWFNHCFTDQTIISGDQVVRAKPAPDIYLAAAKSIGIEPSKCLVFEDAPGGVEAGKAAGMTVIAVPAPNMDLSLYTKADRILKSLLDFCPEQYGLPPFPTS